MCLVDMGFNLGVPRLMKFKNMWEAIERQDFEWASAEMLNSRWAKQVGRRADNLAKRFMITIMPYDCDVSQ